MGGGGAQALNPCPDPITLSAIMALANDQRIAACNDSSHHASVLRGDVSCAGAGGGLCSVFCPSRVHGGGRILCAAIQAEVSFSLPLINSGACTAAAPSLCGVAALHCGGHGALSQ